MFANDCPEGSNLGHNMCLGQQEQVSNGYFLFCSFSFNTCPNLTLSSLDSSASFCNYFCNYVCVLVMIHDFSLKSRLPTCLRCHILRSFNDQVPQKYGHPISLTTTMNVTLLSSTCLQMTALRDQIWATTCA